MPSREVDKDFVDLPHLHALATRGALLLQQLQTVGEATGQRHATARAGGPQGMQHSAHRLQCRPPGSTRTVKPGDQWAGHAPPAHLRLDRLHQATVAVDMPTGPTGHRRSLAAAHSLQPGHQGVSAALTRPASQQNATCLAGPSPQQLPRRPLLLPPRSKLAECVVLLIALPQHPSPTACLLPLTSMQMPHFGPSGSASGGGGGGGLRSCCSSSCFIGDSCGGGWIRGRLAPREGPRATVLRTICRSESPAPGGLLPVRSTTSGAAPAGRRWRCWCCCP